MQPQPPRSAAHSRDPSLSREALVGGKSQNGTPPGSSYQSRPGLERKPSTSYGHHRQTSIVHGMQHSRNPSFVNNTSPNPLSPQLIAAAGTTGPAGLQDGGLGDLSSLLGRSTLNGDARNGSASPVVNQSENFNTVRRLNRAHSAKTSRDYVQHLSHSRPSAAESKTVGEYALHHLFNAFLSQAEQKLKICSAGALGPEPQVEDFCAAGADPAFDQLVAALGHVARQKPKPLIDSLMFWRRDKADISNHARETLEKTTEAAPTTATLTRRNTELTQASFDSTTSRFTGPMSPQREAYAIAERQSIVAIYLLCRVLMEIITQSDLQHIGVETTSKLEEIIFNQIKQPDAEQLAIASLRNANWKSFSQLLGAISVISFATVSDRFFNDLEKYQKELAGRVNNSREVENSLELVILGMRDTVIRTTPDDAWRKSCDFMSFLSKFFVQSHGQRVKLAYCSLLSRLLCSIAGKATSELNLPQWRNVIDLINPRVNQLLAKPRYWADAFPISAVLLCASPADAFSREWHPLALSLQPRLKDRSTRSVALQAICRLTWTHLYRVAEHRTTSVKKLEEVIKIVFPPGKKTYASTETSVSEPMIQFIRLVGFKYQDLCFRTIIFPLINSEPLSNNKEPKVDLLEPDKMVIGIRAFLMIMADLEKGELGRPAFPESFAIPFSPERSSQPPLPNQMPSKSATAPSFLREERLSRPVMTADFGDNAKEHYAKFCEVLGKITIICDNTFGGQAVLDEKFSGITPKTPISDTFSFTRRDDHQVGNDSRQGFYDLLHVAVQALPRCLSPHIPLNPLVNLLCTGTAHVQSNIAGSSVQSLRSIARQGHAQPVILGFSRFIFTFDDRYSTMSDGGMLGPGHIESTLHTYVELLQIWLAEVQGRAKDLSLNGDGPSGADHRGTKLDRSGVFAYVDEVESHALFFLCSQSRRVRSFAITILRLITDFDNVLGGQNSRIINIMEKEASIVLDFKDDQLSAAERSRLQRGMRKNNTQQSIVELCCSDSPYDVALWYKIYPNLMRVSYERCPIATRLSREIVCSRLSQMYKTIQAVSEPIPKPTSHTPFEMSHGRNPHRIITSTPVETTIEQFKLYLIFACTTMTNTGHRKQPSYEVHHVRKSSKAAQLSTEKMNTASALFNHVVPLLAVSPHSVRQAVVIALGAINSNLYRSLLESLQTAVARCNEDARQRIHQRSTSSPRRSFRTDRLRTEITEVYKLTSHFLERSEVYSDDWILTNLVTYTKDLKIFLSDAVVQYDWEFQRLRRHYCGLLEELFQGITRTRDPSRWMSFEARKSAFTLMEDWCGMSPNVVLVQHREETMRQNLADAQKDGTDRNLATVTLETEKRDLKTAALSSMAALCAGPIGIMTEGKSNLQFDIRRMLSWIDSIFATQSDRTHLIGRRALKNLIIHNPTHPFLLDHAIENCFVSNAPRCLESFFEVVTRVIIETPHYPIAFWKIIGLGLFTLGNEKSQIRSKSAQLLRVSEERIQKGSKVQDYDVSVADKTIAVYKLAQFEISKRLAHTHSEYAFHVFSDLSRHFSRLQPASQRNTIEAILPWLHTIELQLDPNGGPTASSHMLLTNLLEITIRFSGTLHNEVQAIWQALATGPHGGNVQLILDFIIQICLDRREQNFVEYAKQVVVFLSSTPAGSKVVEFLLGQISPRTMVSEKREPNVTQPEAFGALPYFADLNLALPLGSKQTGFALGQLAMILLVDLMVSPLYIAAESLPLLLHVIFILWDHYITLTQEQAREMLIHLVHELVISKFDESTSAETRKEVDTLVELIRKHESDVVWQYNESGDKTNDTESRVPKAMSNLAAQVLGVFKASYPNIREQWGKITLTWATSCPVRHLACRSFQVFRCVLTSLDQPMLADMLARLSNTIADTEADVVSFSMEILTTLKTITRDMPRDALTQYPQLFWSTCACLNTIHEQEFLEALSMLEHYIDKIDLGRPEVVSKLTESMPPKWEGSFDGLQALIYKGLRSSASFERSITMLGRLSDIADNPLVGDSSRLLFAFLANLPGFLQSVDDKNLPESQKSGAILLANAADSQGCDLVAQCLTLFANQRYRNSRDLLSQAAHALRGSFFPMWDFKALVFLIGLLTNNLSWLKLQTMRVLCVLIPEIDMRKSEVAAHGPDLISPILRLLQTEFCPQALGVLDNIIPMSGTPNDKHHLRMSMVGSQSRAIRREYDSMQSLFGIPEDSGWAIPTPAFESVMTRANVHAVFYMCGNSESTEEVSASTPEVEFHQEEFQDEFPFPERTATMASDDGGGGNMGDLVQKLDSLDDFFDSTGSPVLDGQNDGGFTDFIGDPLDEARIYDQQTYPILQRTLGRTNSITSFHGLTESRSRDVGVMSPTAFVAPKLPAHHHRPRLRGRSITSPSGSGVSSSSGVDLASDVDIEEHFLSDHEESTVSHGEHSFIDHMIRPVANGARSGMRRLTGGGSREEKRARDVLRADKRAYAAQQLSSKSPKVPKVPSNYLAMSP
ncbi:MAG: Cell morphogenesis protein PAG1 [Vezdaea aestivalis]|nr:MAG: Cell morphogenesis protein PAG1 [Vezdaea aestivalis]